MVVSNGSEPMNNSRGTNYLAMATWIEPTCCAITLKTSMGMRLNSSKQAQAPTAANPLKNFDITAASNPSLQLYTMHCCLKALDKSFVLSVFPVPAGPKKSIKKITKRVLRNWGCINTGNKKRHNTLWIQRRGFKQNKFASLTAMVRNSCRQKQNNLDWIVVGIQK